jgi:hypothetical protein
LPDPESTGFGGFWGIRLSAEAEFSFKPKEVVVDYGSNRPKIWRSPRHRSFAGIFPLADTGLAKP